MECTIYLVTDRETGMPIKVGCSSKYDKRYHENNGYYRRKFFTLVDHEVLATTPNPVLADLLEVKYSRMYGMKEIKPQNRFLAQLTVTERNHMEGNYSGKRYKELTTGFEGTNADMNRRFGVNSNDLSTYYVKLGRPVKRGKLKGLHFTVVS